MNNQLKSLAFEMLDKLKAINAAKTTGTPPEHDYQELIDKIDSFFEKRGCWLDDGAIDTALLPDTCVLDEGELHNCIYAKELFRQGKTKPDCQYWNAGQPKL